MSEERKCPVNHAAGGGTTDRDWWPNRLRLDILHQHSSRSDPMGGDFDYAREFRSLDLAAVKKDRSRLWVKLPAPRRRRGLRKLGCGREVRPRLHRGLEESDESRSLRSGTIVVASPS
jgi:hypothetical protein